MTALGNRSSDIDTAYHRFLLISWMIVVMLQVAIDCHPVISLHFTMYSGLQLCGTATTKWDRFKNTLQLSEFDANQCMTSL